MYVCMYVRERKQIPNSVSRQHILKWNLTSEKCQGLPFFKKGLTTLPFHGSYLPILGRCLLFSRPDLPFFN
jgi:hypothetical protein